MAKIKVWAGLAPSEGCEGSLFFASGGLLQPLVSLGLQTSAFIFTWSSPCVCLCVCLCLNFLFYKDIGHIGLWDHHTL